MYKRQRYSVELFRNDPKILGELRVSARTQNAGLLRMLDHFFRLWEKLENRYLSAVYPAGVSCRIENGRYCRTFFWPEESCTNAQLGESISSYIQNFDCALKAFFELDEQNWKVGIDQISLRYQKALQKEKIPVSYTYLFHTFFSDCLSFTFGSTEPGQDRK